MNPQKITLLLVEDDEIDVEAVRRGLKRHNINNPIVHAADGVEALSILRGENGCEKIHRPYIVLLDLNMPRMNGIEFLEALRTDESLNDAVVFVLTTSDDDVDRARAYHLQVAGYMVKSQVGPGFRKAADLLNTYWSTVRLPQ